MAKQIMTGIIFNSGESATRITKAIIQCFEDKSCSLQKATIIQSKEQVDVTLYTNDTFTVFKFGQYYERV